MQEKTCLLPAHRLAGGSRDLQERGTPGFLQRNIEQSDSNLAGGRECLWNQCLCSTQCCCLNGKWFNRKRQL